jgi:hypothetical protein
MYQVESDLEGLLKRLENCKARKLSPFFLDTHDLHFLVTKKLLRADSVEPFWNIQYTIDCVVLMVVSTRLSK